MVTLALAFNALGCGSRYDPARCPSSPFPAARMLLARPGFEVLQYFRGGPGDPRRESETEIWTDGKFAFQASLQYEYLKTRPECPLAVRMVLQYPLSPERILLGKEFLSAFEHHLGVRLEALRAALRPGDLSDGSAAPIVAEAGQAVAEAISLRTANRGDVLALSVVDRAQRPRPSEAP